MTKIVLFAAPLVLALAGCVSDEQAAPTAYSPTPPTTATAPATPAATPTPTAPANWRSIKPHAPGSAAESLCVKAVQQQTNAEGVGVLSSAPAATGTQVWLAYPAAEAPWNCMYSNAHITEVGPVNPYSG